MGGQLALISAPIELCMAPYQGLYVKFGSMMSPKFSIVDNDREEMMMALHTHFQPQQQYFRVYAQFLGFHTFVYRWGCQFLSFFFHKITNIRSRRYFSSSKIRTQFSHTFCAIFSSFVQAYAQPYSFGGRIKLIICQIRYELSVTIHEINTS